MRTTGDARDRAQRACVRRASANGSSSGVSPLSSNSSGFGHDRGGKIHGVNAPSLADKIDSLLPQTQCTRCGFASCRPYAEAIAKGAAAINRCAPGGPQLIAALATLTGQPAQSLDPECGAHGPLGLARIDEAACIGCTLCIAACPVDAIIGGAKRMHTVLPSLCTGCELCVPPCPVDCIAIEPASREWTDSDAEAARERFRIRNIRVARAERVAKRSSAPADSDASSRQARVAAAFARARARRAASRAKAE